MFLGILNFTLFYLTGAKVISQYQKLKNTSRLDKLTLLFLRVDIFRDY